MKGKPSPICYIQPLKWMIPTEGMQYKRTIVSTSSLLSACIFVNHAIFATNEIFTVFITDYFLPSLFSQISNFLIAITLY